MKSNVSGITAIVLVLVAFSSLVSMIALTRIDNIVHQDLYRYDLKFSYGWAMPYWTMTTLIFAMGWFNIIIAIAFQFYVLLYGRRAAAVIPEKEALKPETIYQPPIEEKPREAEKEKVEDTFVPAMEVEVDTHKEIDEAKKSAEEPKEEYVTVDETSQEYIETEQHEEDKTQKEQETETPEWMETQREPEEKFEESQETVDVQPQEEPFYAYEEEREQEEMPRETAETETYETPPPSSEIEAETTETEESQTQTWTSTEEDEAPAEETQQETELTEHYPT